MSLMDNINTRLEYGVPGELLVSRCSDGTWCLEGVDNNGVRVLAEPGIRYESLVDAVDALISSGGGSPLGLPYMPASEG